MRPSQFNSKKEINHNGMDNISHLLKINRDSHIIRKSFSSSSSYSSSSSSSVSVSAPILATKTPPRQPLIIYTRPPKVIHTNPDDFMALVQKLTGLSRPEGNPNPIPKQEPNVGAHGPKDLIKVSPKAANSDESESSVVTEDSCHNMILEDVHAISCFPQTTKIFDTNMNHYCYDHNIPSFMLNDYCTAPLFDNYVDPLVLVPNRTTNLEALKELRDF